MGSRLVVKTLLLLTAFVLPMTAAAQTTSASASNDKSARAWLQMNEEGENEAIARLMPPPGTVERMFVDWPRHLRQRAKENLR